MSPPIKIGKFTILFLVYLLISLIIYVFSAFTIAAWLFYIPILLPFYLLGVAHLISLNLKHPQKSMRYRRVCFYPIAFFQLLTLVSSPTNCYGFKQGKACSSFLQSLLINERLINPEQWQSVDLIFPIALFLYIIAVGVFLALLRLEPK